MDRYIGYASPPPKVAVHALSARLIRVGVTALAGGGLAGGGTAAAAAAEGGHGHRRHRGREHHPVVTDGQRQCMADLGFGFGPGIARPDFHDPAVRAHFVAALRSCGILPPAPVEPTTTISGPVIVTSLNAR